MANNNLRGTSGIYARGPLLDMYRLDNKTEEWLRKWREAANILAKNVNAQVICPECGIGHLMVKDEVVESRKKFDRYMICDHCSRWNVMTMDIPENYNDNNVNPVSK